jgi:hypothetical protein
LEVLQKIYEHLGVAPKHNLLIIDKFNERFANVEDLIIDGSGATPLCLKTIIPM